MLHRSLKEKMTRICLPSPPQIKIRTICISFYDLFPWAKIEFEIETYSKILKQYLKKNLQHLGRIHYQHAFPIYLSNIRGTYPMLLLVAYRLKFVVLRFTFREWPVTMWAWICFPSVRDCVCMRPCWWP